MLENDFSQLADKLIPRDFWYSGIQIHKQKIPAGADDISIRLPRPPFKLPEPPTPNP